MIHGETIADSLFILTQIIEDSPLPPGTTSQQAELVTLTQTLSVARSKSINIFTDSKYTYNVIHSNVLIWRERGFLTRGGTPILDTGYIRSRLKAALSPCKVAGLHCRGHEANEQYISLGNEPDRLATQVALSGHHSQSSQAPTSVSYSHKTPTSP